MTPRLALAVLALVLGGCAPVVSSAYRTAPGPAPAAPVSPASAAAVRILAAGEPGDADEVGVVEAAGRVGVATLPQLVDAFRARVAELGGDVGRVDALRTRYEWVTETYDYDCGTTETKWETRTSTRIGMNGKSETVTESVPVTEHVSKTCQGTRQVEVATRTLVGRALKLRRGT